MKLSLNIQTPEIKSISPLALLKGSFKEKLIKAAGLGADGVELLTIEPETMDVDAIRSGVQQVGLEVSAIGSGAIRLATGLTLLHSEPTKANLAKLKLQNLINFAVNVGAPLVTIGGFRGRIAFVGNDGRKSLLQILLECASYAHSRGIRLALEPLNRYETDVIINVDDALAFINDVNHPALGILLDTYHVNIEESSWTEPFRKAMDSGKLWHVHLGDNNRLPPGQGLIDFEAIITTLRELDYTYYLSAELIPQPDADTAARQTLAFMHNLVEKQ